jgi:glutaredoxin
MDLAPPLPEGLAGDSPVTVLWRPGCPYCALLLRGLTRTGLVFDRIDIWEHPEAAAWVRTVADGNETVPTVRIASSAQADAVEEAVALVNPSPRAVLDVLARLAPEALPTGTERQRASVSARIAARFSAWLSAWFRGRPGRGRGRAAPR